MNARLNAFNRLQNHPWLSRVFEKLSKADLDFCREFIDSTSYLNKGDFEYLVNRLFLDCPEKPKTWKEIEELLNCANSSVES